MSSLLSRLFGDSAARELRRLQPLVDAVNALHAEYSALSDDALRGKTAEFKERLASGETLDDLLPEAFAAVREASTRTTEVRPFDGQLIGGGVPQTGEHG